MDLNKFIDKYCFYITLNMNDTFGYALSAGCDIDNLDIPKLLEVEEKFGSGGVDAFASIIEECGVISPLETKEFKEALEYLKGHTFYSKQNCYKDYHCCICACVHTL